MEHLKTFCCLSENIKVEIWGFSRHCEGWSTGRISDIIITQNDNKSTFGGWKFHAWDAVKANAIARRKGDYTLQWYGCGKYYARWYIMGNVYNRSEYRNRQI